MPQEHIHLRSESVQEVLSNPPSWLVRYGITLIFGIILLILLVSWWVKYPDFVEAPTTVTSQNPPEKLQSRINDKIEKLWVQNQEEVQPNQVLLALRSNANIEDILTLRNILDSVKANNINQLPITQISQLNIGELENDFTQLRQAYNEYQLNSSLQPYRVENKANTQMQSELQTRIAEIMLEINNKEPNKIDEAMSDWYLDNSMKNWIQKWGTANEHTYNAILEDHKIWCFANSLDYTPALVVNNKIFPKFYDMTDIQYFIEYITKYEQNNLQNVDKKDYQLQQDNLKNFIKMKKLENFKLEKNDLILLLGCGTVKT